MSCDYEEHPTLIMCSFNYRLQSQWDIINVDTFNYGILRLGMINVECVHVNSIES